MHKILFFLLCLVSYFLADSLQNDVKIDILAKNINTKDNILTATGDVVAFSKTYYITAEKLIYDKEKQTLELFDNVSIVRQNSEKSFSEYMFLNLQDEIKTTQPVVLIDANSKMWFSSQKVESMQKKYNFDSTTFSSCECDDPDWSVLFSSGDFNAEDQWINMYNTTLYIKDFPIFYTPYFGFSTNNTRHSGFLPPTVGLSDAEGLLYSQPIYYAPRINYDIEYIPQIRSKRGHGHNLKLRYIDSIYSKLQIESGIFYDKQSYYKRENLTNKKHYGWNISYDRAKIFSNYDHQDGLKLYVVGMNDIDYVNTQHDDDTSHYDDKFLTSNLKYFYNTNDFYGDVEVKKYVDVTLDNNNSILQDRPIVNFHKYYDSIFFNNLLYSFDSSFKKQTRDIGPGVDHIEFSLPMIYTQSFFNDFLNLSIGEKINYLYFGYLNDKQLDDGNYGTLTHSIELNTNLLKFYDDFSHGIQLGLRYTNPHDIVQTGDLYNITTYNIDIIDFPITTTNEQISLFFDQTFYENSDFASLLEHKISQKWDYDEFKNSYEKGNLEHDLLIYYGNSILSNRFYYSYQLKKIVESSTMFEYIHNKGFFRLYHNYEKDQATLINQEDIIYHFGLKLTNKHTVEYKIEYDLTNNLDKKKEYIFNIDENCWSINFKYIDSIIATDTITDRSKRQNIFYVELNLKELFNFKQQYKSDK